MLHMICCYRYGILATAVLQSFQRKWSPVIHWVLKAIYRRLLVDASFGPCLHFISDYFRLTPFLFGPLTCIAFVLPSPLSVTYPRLTDILHRVYIPCIIFVLCPVLCKERYDLRFLYLAAFDLEVLCERLVRVAMLKECDDDDGMLE